MLILSTLSGLCLAGSETTWETVELSNEIPLTLVHAPDSPRQHFFTFLPHGLLADAKDRPQFAHLLEHLAIRSTDPEALEAGGVTMNGETGALSLRLDTYAVPERWREALERHALWIEEWRALEALDAAVLEREKGKIALEEQSTVARGYAHKWADAAWAQVVRHGAKDVALHGAVAGATVEELRADLAGAPRGLGGIRLVSAGPVDPETVRAAAEELFGELDTAKALSSRPSATVESIRRAGARQATWDLESAHLVEWYPLPDARPGDRLAGLLLAQLLNARAMAETALAEKGVHLAVAPDLLTPEGRWLKFSANLPAGVEPEAVHAAVRACLEGVRASGAAALKGSLAQAAAEFAQTPDLSALRKQFAARGTANDFMEGNLVLGLVNLEWMSGLDRAELAKSAAALEADRLLEVVAGWLEDGRSSSLVLRPRDSGD